MFKMFFSIIPLFYKTPYSKALRELDVTKIYRYESELQ